MFEHQPAGRGLDDGGVWSILGANHQTVAEQPRLEIHAADLTPCRKRTLVVDRANHLRWLAHGLNCHRLHVHIPPEHAAVYVGVL